MVATKVQCHAVIDATVFLQHVAARSGVSIAIADRLLPSVLHTLGRHLRDGDRQLVADELPPSLGALLLIDMLPLPTRAGLTEARVRAFVIIVCNVLLEGLSARAGQALRSSGPADLLG
jgi:uncharacterized protein (DUF2267 family)